MKKMIRKMLMKMISVFAILILVFMASFHIHMYKEQYKEQSYVLFEQVENILEESLLGKDKPSYIFSSYDGTLLYVLGSHTGEILGSTNMKDIGKNMQEIGLTDKKMLNSEEVFFCEINGVKHYCIARDYGSIILLRSNVVESLYMSILVDVALMAFWLLVVAVFMVIWTERFLDKNIIKGIYEINETLTNGDLHQLVEVNHTPEFELLSNGINAMRKSLVSKADKMSYVMGHASLPAGFYEYDIKTGIVYVTDKVTQILNLSDIEAKELCSNVVKFEAFIQNIKANPIKEAENTYLMDKKLDRYVRIEEDKKGSDVIGIVINVTETVRERKEIANERDIDLLTGIYNRRALESILDEIYYDSNKIKHSVLIMLDADGLKQINDNYGHQAGDAYLCAIVKLLKKVFPANTLISRQGGDEFVIYLYGCDTDKEIMSYLHTLSDLRDKESFLIEGEKIRNISFSFGYIFCYGRTEGYLELLAQADNKMYQEKSARKAER